MKELSIEEKARAYDEALALMVDCVPDEDGLVHVKPHEIFSELAESEDERIRKEFCKDIWNYIPYEKAQKYITWLKKQVEQKPILDVEIPFGAKDSELEEVSYSIPDGYHAEIEDNKIVIKKGEQKPTKVEPKFNVGDTMRTLQEASDGITDGMPVVVSIDNEYYHCTNELIAIKDQDDYEFPPINMKQKSADKVEPKFHEGDCIIHHGTNNIYQVVAIIDNQYQLKYGDTYVIQTCADIDRCARLFKPKFNVDDWVVNNTTHNVCRILKVEHGQYICDNCSFPITKENEYHLWTIKDAKDKMATYLSQTKLQTEQKPTDRVKPKFHEGDWVVISTSDGRTIVQVVSIEYFPSGQPRYITSEGRWFDNGTKARLLTDKDTIPESKAIVNKIKSWSEEDEEELEIAIETLSKAGQYSSAMWLKSLKQRIEWKPSKEQIKALHDLNLVGNISYVGQAQLLIELYNDLKKLIV